MRVLGVPHSPNPIVRQPFERKNGVNPYSRLPSDLQLLNIGGLTSAQKDIPALDILHSLVSRRVDLVALGYVLRVSSEDRTACAVGCGDDQRVDSAGEDGHRVVNQVVDLVE